MALGVGPQPHPLAERTEEGTPEMGVAGQRPGGVNDDRNRPEGWEGKGAARSRGVQGGEVGEVRRDAWKRLRSKVVFGHLITPPMPQPLSSERAHQ